MERFKKILFVGADPVHDIAALKRATSLAVDNQASLTVIGVVAAQHRDARLAVLAITPTEVLDSVVAEKQSQLEDMVSAAAPADGLQISIKVLVGKAFLEIIREVLRTDHDLVIKAAESTRGVMRLFGSTDMQLLRKCPCPVWIIKPTDHEHYRRILAAVDQDPEDATTDPLNRQILEMSTSLAMTESSELHVVHAWNLANESILRSPRLGPTSVEVDAMVREEENNQRRWLENLVDTFGGQKTKDAVEYLEPQLHLEKGNPTHEVPRRARELDVELIVMGTLGRVGISGFFMGNTAEEILEQIDCSVLAIKPPGFASPVSLT